MKNQLTHLVLSASLLCCLQEVNAQSWSLTGNAGTTSANFIGTTDLTTLRFKTNNVTRMTITGTGKIGIANGAPVSRLDIIGIGTSVDPVVKIVGKYIGSADVIGLDAISTPTDTNGIGVRGTGNFIGVQGSSNIIGVDGFGIVGTFGSSAVGDELSGPTGVWGEADSGDVANGVFGFAGRGNQNIAVWGIATDTATVGGIRDYAGFFQGNVFGYRFFQLSDERMKKDIQPLTATLERLMKVQTATYKYRSAEQQLLHLPAGLQTGFLAANLEEQFPDMVSNTSLPEKYNPKEKSVVAEAADVKVVNYIGMIPVLTRAIQEQQLIIEQKEATLQQLQAQLSKMEQRLQALENENKVSTDRLIHAGAGSALQSPVPNPTSDFTSVEYQLEKGVKGSLVISQSNGQVVREIELSDAVGRIRLDVSDLPQGQYFYTLYSNGTPLQTKSFQVIR